jgi:filamentous hemagglutinin family protein
MFYSFCVNKFKNSWKQPLFWISIGLFGLNVAPLRAQQVSADGTLNTLVSSQNNLDFTIVNGTRSGQNLFHSFREFSIPKDGSAIFDLKSSPDIVNIFSRVTSDRASNINGTIQTIGGNRPNVFLLNPNGILFGPQAKLDVGGSFLATTAQGIQFDNGVVFSNLATTNTLLNVRVPVGIQMGFNPAGIQVTGLGHAVVSQGSQAPYRRNMSTSDLRVQPGNTLALLGGEINLDGGVLTAGNIELGTPLAGRLGENAFVGLQSIVNGFKFDYSQVSSYGNIQLSNQSLVDISAQSAGTIQINAQDLKLRDGSLLFSSAIGSTKGQIKVTTQGTFLMEGRTDDRKIGSGIEVYATGSGEGAAIDISTRDLIIRDIARVSSQASEKASTGDIQVQASQSVRLNSQLLSNSVNDAAIIALTNGQGNAGDIKIKTPFLQVIDNAVISAATFGAGNAGNVSLVTDRIELATGGTLGSSSFVQGDAGTINIQTRSLNLSNGGLISSNSLGRGNAGSIDINASENVTLLGLVDTAGTSSQIRSTVRNASPTVQRIFKSPTTATGNGGSIVIRSPKISLDRNAEINVRNEGTGEGGDINLQTQNLQLNHQSSLNAATRIASGGNIRITADNVSLRNESSINVTAGSRGEGGIIQIDTALLLGLENSDIIANAFRGNGGQIRIKADQIFGLEYRSQLTSDSDITAISQYGQNGSVSISDLRLEPNAELLPLPVTLSDEKQRISDRCQETRSSRFIITGRGGLPKSPTWNLDSNRAWRDIRQPIGATSTEASTIPAPTIPFQTAPLVEASTWQTNADGSVSLLAPGSRSTEMNIASATCGMLKAVISQ